MISDQELEELLKLADKIGEEVQKGKTEGIMQCTCGGTIRWASGGPRSMRAACDRCTFSVMS